jgi:hypothetical protein
VEARPLKDTRYTLTAEGGDGRAASESFVLRVHPDEAALPEIAYFKVSSHKVEGGRHLYTLVFGDKNGEEVSLDPPVFPTLHGAPSGQFFVSPDKTTTYTLTVTGQRGHTARRQVTVEVPGT